MIKGNPTETVKIPRRLRWTKRFIWLFVLLIVALIIVRLIWGHIASQRLAAAIADVRSRGEPLLPEDYPHPVDTSANNAALTYQQAFTAFIPPGDAVDNLDWDWNTRFSPSDLKQLEAAADKNRAAIDLLIAGGNCKVCVWDWKFGSPIIMTLLPRLSQERTLAYSAKLDAYLKHLRGDDAGAIANLTGIIRLSDDSQSDFPCLVGNLVSVGLQAMGDDSISSIAPDLQIGEKPSTNQPAPAPREKVQSLIAILSNESAYRDGGVRGIDGERVSMLDDFNYITGSANHFGYLIVRPWFELDITHCLHVFSNMRRAYQAPDYPKAKMIEISGPKFGKQKFPPMPLLSSLLMPSLGRSLDTHFRGLTDRRAAAIALALRLYQVDHDNTLPESLNELTSKYLSTIPLDPFAADGSAMRYKRLSPVTAIIYSVGNNGKDNNGSEKSTIAAIGHTRHNRYEAEDMVYHYANQPAATLPSGQLQTAPNK